MSLISSLLHNARRALDKRRPGFDRLRGLAASKIEPAATAAPPKVHEAPADPVIEAQPAGAEMTPASDVPPAPPVAESTPEESLVAAHGMTFFSQFGEDALLRGYFRHRHEARRRKGLHTDREVSSIGSGFFVDVGCYHPVQYSNTYHLYRSGWRGINVDPTPGTKELFDEVRPDDITLELAVADTEGSLSFFGPGGRSLFNSLVEEQAQAYVDAGWFPKYVETVVQSKPLATIFKEYLPEGQKIDVLDIDVEGFDVQVLQSNDWSKYRPELVLVECHSRAIEEVAADERSKLLLKEGYRIHAWLPPNVLFVDTHL